MSSYESIRSIKQKRLVEIAEPIEGVGTKCDVCGLGAEEIQLPRKEESKRNLYFEGTCAGCGRVKILATCEKEKEDKDGFLRNFVFVHPWCSTCYGKEISQAMEKRWEELLKGAKITKVGYGGKMNKEIFYLMVEKNDKKIRVGVTLNPDNKYPIMKASDSYVEETMKTMWEKSKL